MDAFTITGLKKQIDPSLQGQDIMELWKQLWLLPVSQEFMKEGVMPLAVYFDYKGDQTNPYSLIVGFKSKKNVSEFETLEVPSLNVKKFKKKGKMPQIIFDSWQDVWDSNIKRSFDFDVEEYPNENTVELNISLK